MNGIESIPSSPGVYRLIIDETGDSYIGQSGVSMRQRIEYHYSRLSNGCSDCKGLLAAVLEHGVEKFRCEVLVVCDGDSALEKERELIAEHNPTLNRKGGSRRREPLPNPDERIETISFQLVGSMYDALECIAIGKGLNIEEMVKRWAIKQVVNSWRE